MLHPTAIPYLVAFAVSAIVVWLSTPIIRYFGLKAGLVDKPNHRKMHTTPVVRVGGIAIFIGSVTALLLVWAGGYFGILPQNREYEVWGVTIGGAAFFLIGFADDLFNLPPLPRLIAQLAVSAAAWRVGVRIDFISIPFWGIIKFGWFSLPITMVWLSGMANAINWLDGLDGLAAGVSTIAAAVILITNNFKPKSSAEIFMGDGGAYFLGFTLAGVSVIGLVKAVATVALIMPYMILAVPIVDATAVILQRIGRGESPMAAGKQHLHHRLVQAGVSKRLTVLFIYALTLWVGSIAMAISGMPAGGTYAAISTLLMIYACWKVWQRIRAKELRSQQEKSAQASQLSER